MLNYQIPQNFILVLTFFPALMSITHTLHLSTHPNVPGTSAWPWDQVSSPNSLRSIIIILNSSTMPCQELYKDHQFLFFKGSKWVSSITPIFRPRAQLLDILLQHFAGWDNCICHRVCFRVSASAWSSVLSHSHGSELLKKTQYHFLLKWNPLPSWLHWENCPQKTQALNLNTLSSAMCSKEFPG